jgi:hypothetical protein
MADTTTTAAPAATTTALTAQESKIKASLMALLSDIEKVPGEASAFLTNAKSHIANAVVHIEAHFTRAKAIATADAAKVETAASTVATEVKSDVKADVAKADATASAVKAAV